MLGFGDLVLCSGTLPHSTLPEKISAAAGAGFRGISLFYSDYTQAKAQGLSDADLKSMLADFGLEIAELDPLMSWVPDDDAEAATLAAGPDADRFLEGGEANLYALADALGARSINAVLMKESALDLDQIADCFGGLCDRAVKRGLLVHLEFLPWTQIKDLPTALEIVQRADRPNGGIMLDSWHHFRSGVANEVLDGVPGERISAIQLNDAPTEPGPDVIVETLRHRLLPGEGDIDLVDLMQRLRKIGCTAPIGVEIFSERLAQLPAEAIAEQAAASTRALLSKAWSPA